MLYWKRFFCVKDFDNNEIEPMRREGGLISDRRDTMERKNNDLRVPLFERNGRRIWLSQVWQPQSWTENRLRNVFNSFGWTSGTDSGGSSGKQRWKESVHSQLTPKSKWSQQIEFTHGKWERKLGYFFASI